MSNDDWGDSCRNWSDPASFAHPDSPNGGAGPGFSSDAGPINYCSTSPVPHPDSPAGRYVTYLPQEDVSYELADAPYVCVPTSVGTISLAEMRVLAWLMTHATEIVAAEKRFHVDRRAIAGAIAWEAVMNVRGSTAGAVGRFVGPGKAHVKNHFWNIGGSDTLVKQLEDAAWLPKAEQIPKQSYEDRKRTLATPGGAIVYIAAAMNAAAHMAEDAKFPSIRKRPEILTFFWQKKDLKTWGELLASKPAGSDFKTGPDPKTDMDRWVSQNLKLLEDGVGTPDF